MIVRIWHGRTKAEHAAAYRDFVIEKGIAEYLSIRGNCGAEIWQQPEGNIVHIWTISWWKDYDCIKEFAGENIEQPKYYEEDKFYLLEFEPLVKHCESYHFLKR